MASYFIKVPVLTGTVDVANLKTNGLKAHGQYPGYYAYIGTTPDVDIYYALTESDTSTVYRCYLISKSNIPRPSMYYDKFDSLYGPYEPNFIPEIAEGKAYLWTKFSGPRATDNLDVTINGEYYDTAIVFDSWEDMVEMFIDYTPTVSYPITYRDTNCTHSGPESASPGDTVTVGYTFADGYGIANSSDIYVTNNGVLVPSQYSNGTLTFTMPDQS